MTEIRLPASLTEITGTAFAHCSNLHTLIVDSANTTYRVKDNIIYTRDMKKLVCAAGAITQVAIPDTVTEIGEGAFNGRTGLPEIRLPAGLAQIGTWAFEDCTGLREIRLPASLTEINPWAFDGCTGLTEILLPANLTKIAGSAFAQCSNLHTLIVDSANTTYRVKDNVIYTRDMKKLVCAAGAITQVSIPDTVTEIGEGAFNGRTGLPEIRLPAGLAQIGSRSFHGCIGLVKVDLSACTSLKEIGEWAFSDCTGLTEVSLPASLTFIGPQAFKYISPSVKFNIPNKKVEKLLKDSNEAF